MFWQIGLRFESSWHSLEVHTSLLPDELGGVEMTVWNCPKRRNVTPTSSDILSQLTLFCSDLVLFNSVSVAILGFLIRFNWCWMDALSKSAIFLVLCCQITPKLRFNPEFADWREERHKCTESKHCRFRKLNRICETLFPLSIFNRSKLSKSEWENKLELSPVQFITFSTICWSPTPFLIRFHAACRVRFAKMSASHRGLRTTVSKNWENPWENTVFLKCWSGFNFLTVLSGKKASTGVGLFFVWAPNSAQVLTRPFRRFLFFSSSEAPSRASHAVLLHHGGRIEESSLPAIRVFISLLEIGNLYVRKVWREGKKNAKKTFQVSFLFISSSPSSTRLQKCGRKDYVKWSWHLFLIHAARRKKCPEKLRSGMLKSVKNARTTRFCYQRERRESAREKTKWETSQIALH